MYIFFVKNKLLDSENAVLGIKIGQQNAEKDFMDKNRDSVPVCGGIASMITKKVKD